MRVFEGRWLQSRLATLPLGSPAESSVAVRAIGIWVLVRVVAGYFSRLLGGDLLYTSLPTALLIIAIVGLVTANDARRHNEHLFLANLGTSGLVFALLCAVPPLICEIALAVVT